MSNSHPVLALIIASADLWIILNFKKLVRKSYFSTEKGFRTFQEGDYLQSWKSVGWFVSYAQWIISIIVVLGFAFSAYNGFEAVCLNNAC